MHTDGSKQHCPAVMEEKKRDRERERKGEAEGKSESQRVSRGVVADAEDQALC